MILATFLNEKWCQFTLIAHIVSSTLCNTLSQKASSWNERAVNCQKVLWASQAEKQAGKLVTPLDCKIRQVNYFMYEMLYEFHSWTLFLQIFNIRFYHERKNNFCNLNIAIRAKRTRLACWVCWPQQGERELPSPLTFCFWFLLASSGHKCLKLKTQLEDFNFERKHFENDWSILYF